MNLDLDLQTTTVASVKATVDAHLESVWRASGVRILRSDLPFRGITLKYRNRLLAMDKLLSVSKIRKGSKIHAQPRESEKEERRKRSAKERRTKDERKVRREKDTATRKRNSEVLENTTHATPETGGDEQTSSMWVSSDRPGEEAEVGAEGDDTNAGARDLGGEIAHEVHDDQQAEEQGHEERVTREIEQDDPFADEDDNKENRDPMIAPVLQPRANDDPARNMLLFDERNSGIGVDLLEEVLEF